MSTRDEGRFSETFERMIMNRRRFILSTLATGAAVGVAGLAGCGGTEAPTATTAPAPEATTPAAPAATTPPAATATTAPAAVPTAAASPAALAEAPVETPIPEEMETRWKGTGEVVVVGWGGASQEALKKAVFDPFTQFSGIKVVEDTDPSAAKVRTMVDSGEIAWDVVWTDPMVEAFLNKQGDYLQPIDYSMLDTDNIDASYRWERSVAFVMITTAMAYRTDVLVPPNVPKTWADFWDVEKFPGTRSMGQVDLPLEFALMAAGVPMDQVYVELAKPDGIDRAFASLDKIKPHVVTWWDAGAVPVQQLTDKEVPLVNMWNSRIPSLKTAGVPAVMEYNQGWMSPDAWNVVAKCKNRENAMKFLGYCLSPRPQARFCMAINAGWVNKKAAQYVPAEVLATMNTSPENLKKQLLREFPWWVENREKVVERWTTWKAG